MPRGRAMLMLTPNGIIAAATLNFAAYAAGVILCPVSTAFGLIGGDHARLRQVIAKTRPALIYVDRAPRLAAAVADCASDAIAIVKPDTDLFSRPIAALSTVLATMATVGVAQAIAAIYPEDVASYMLTS